MLRITRITHLMCALSLTTFLSQAVEIKTAGQMQLNNGVTTGFYNINVQMQQIGGGILNEYKYIPQVIGPQYVVYPTDKLYDITLNPVNWEEIPDTSYSKLPPDAYAQDYLTSLPSEISNKIKSDMSHSINYTSNRISTSPCYVVFYTPVAGQKQMTLQQANALKNPNDLWMWYAPPKNISLKISIPVGANPSKVSFNEVDNGMHPSTIGLARGTYSYDHTVLSSPQQGVTNHNQCYYTIYKVTDTSINDFTGRVLGFLGRTQHILSQ